MAVIKYVTPYCNLKQEQIGILLSVSELIHFMKICSVNEWSHVSDWPVRYCAIWQTQFCKLNFSLAEGEATAKGDPVMQGDKCLPRATVELKGLNISQGHQTPTAKHEVCPSG